jgi:alpha/beta hydrolase family protein/CARDB protein
MRTVMMPVAFARCAALSALMTIGSLSVGFPARAAVPDLPTIEGPITGPGDMQPGIRNGPDGTNLEEFGYTVEEYFISGVAAGVAYKTRILIRKPPLEKFSGVLIAEPTHRGGNGLICQFARYGIAQRGHACVQIAARFINLSNPATPGAGLKEFNPGRYASLTLLNNASGTLQANTIIAQAGRLLKSNLSGGPMGAYQVRTMVIGGTSDSSGATRNYMNMTAANHTNQRMPDSSAIYDGYFVSSILGPTAVATLTDVPIIAMPTQFELHSSNAFRRPDSDDPLNRYREYEMSGMSHNDARENPAFTDCTHPQLSRYPYGAMTFMGLQHMIDWAVNGTIPPREASFMEIDNDLSDGTRVALDENGNAKGGVRTTYLDLPVYTYTIPNAGPGLCNQTGYETRLSDEVLRSLYGPFGQSTYLQRIESHLQELLAAGWFPAEYADRYVRQDAKDFNVLPPDLVAGAVTVSGAPLFQGYPATFSAQVRNAAPDGAAGVKVRFLVDGATVNEQTIAQLAAGASTTVSAQWPSAPGNHSVQVVLDPDNTISELDETNNTAAATFAVTADTVAPTTVATPSPAPNAAGWNNGNVTVALSASDNAGGSGVRSITYAVGGGAATTVSGASASLSLATEGATTISYFATDNVGNAEAAKTLTVRIDKTPPVATLSLSPDRIWPPNHKFVTVSPSLSASDNLSAVSVSAPVVTSNEPQAGCDRDDAPGDWSVSGASIALRAERCSNGGGRTYTVTYTITDAAGNSSQASAVVFVPHNAGKE